MELDLLNRTLGPACSRVEHFLCGEADHLHRAYGVAGGTLVVQRLQTSGGEQGSGKPATTVVVIDDIRLEGSNSCEEVRHVRWGGGRACFLAAATRTSVRVFSLEECLSSRGADRQQDGMCVCPLGGYRAVHAAQMDGVVIDMAWSGAADGIIISDDTGRVTYLKVVKNKPGSNQGEVIGESMEAFWTVEQKIAQDLIAAGPTARSPSSSGLGNVSRIVNVWWPAGGAVRRENLPHPSEVLCMDWSAPLATAGKESYSALLTMCVDGVVRVWVEAMLGPPQLLGSGALLSGNSGQLRPKFCVVLAIEVNSSIATSGVYAMWIKNVPPKAKEGRELWVAVSGKLPCATDSSDEEGRYLRIWALDTLPLSLPGIATGAPYSHHCPTALPWGHAEFPATTAGASVQAVLCYLLQARPVPEFLLVESSEFTATAKAQTHCLVLDSRLMEQETSIWSCQLFAKSSSHSYIEGPETEVKALVLHPHQAVACSVGLVGSIGLWDLQSAKQMLSLSVEGELGGVHAGAASWLSRPSDRQIENDGDLGMLAVAGVEGIVVFSVHKTVEDVGAMGSSHQLISAEVVEVGRCPLSPDITNVKGLLSLASGQEWSSLLLVWGVRNAILPAGTLEDVGTLVAVSGADDSGVSVVVHRKVYVLPAKGLSIDQADRVSSAPPTLTCITRSCFGAPHWAAGTSGCELLLQDLPLIDKNDVLIEREIHTLDVQGVPVSIACCPHAAYMACATTLGPLGAEESLWIFQSESAGCGINYHKDTTIRLKGTSSGLAWLPGPVLGVLVGFDTGAAKIWVRTRAGEWSCAAQYNTTLPVTSVLCTPLCLPVVAASSHLFVISNASGAVGKQHQTPGNIMGVALDKGGALRDYDPYHLRLLMASGDSIAASSIVRNTVAWLQQQEEKDSPADSACCLPPPPVSTENLLLKRITEDPCDWADQSDNFVEKEAYASVQASSGIGSVLWPSDQPESSPTVSGHISSGLSRDGANSMWLGGKTVSPAAVHPSGKDTGLLDMAAFGMDPLIGAASSPTMQMGAGSRRSSFGDAPRTNFGDTVRNSLDTGMLSLGAFGFGGAATTDVQDVPIQETTSLGSVQAAGSQEIHSGMLDPSSFGFGYSGPVEASLPTDMDGSIVSGALDPTMFGFGGLGGNSPRNAGGHDPCISSGTLDMSAFGLAQEEPVEPPHPVHRSGSLSTGTFGLSSGRFETNVVDDGVPVGTGIGNFGSLTADGSGKHARMSSLTTIEAVQENPTLPHCEVPIQCLALNRGILRRADSDVGSSGKLLSAAELQSFRSLIGWDEGDTDARNGETGSAEGMPDIPRAAGSFGLSRSLAKELGDLAGLLCDECPDMMDSKQNQASPIYCSQTAEQLDESARRVVLCVQMATLTGPQEVQSSAPKSPRMSGARSWSTADLPSVAATAEHLPKRVSSYRSMSALLTSEDTGANKLREDGPQSWSEQVGLLPGLHPAVILWALQSQTQGALFDVCVSLTAPRDASETCKKLQTAEAMFSPAKGKKDTPALSWEQLRAAGAGLWMTDAKAAQEHASSLAKAQFAAKRDPEHCALLNLALGRQRVVSGLFRTAGNAKVADLLGKDFNDKRNREMAAKNAFVLLGQHRHSLAAGLFIAGGQVRDGLSVCAHEMQDPQLALFLATLIEGALGPLKKELVEKELLPKAEACGDRGAVAVLLWLTGRTAEAMQSIAAVRFHQPVAVLDTAVSEVLLLQFAIDHGLQQMSGRYVPVSLLQDLSTMAGHCAHDLDVGGVPVMALKALAVAETLQLLVPKHMRMDDHTLCQWRSRLITVFLSRHLPQSQVVDTEDESPLWKQRAIADIALLHQYGYDFADGAVLQQLEDFMLCLQDARAALHRGDGAEELRANGHGLMLPRPLSRCLDRTMSGSQSAGRESGDGASAGQQEPILCLDAKDLLQIEGDKCVGVCCARTTEQEGQTNGVHAHKVAVATMKHGLHYVDFGPPVPTVTAGRAGFVSQKLQQHQWPACRFAKPRLTRSLSRRSAPAVQVQELHTGLLEAHPTHNLFLSGSPNGIALLRRFGESSPCASFMPLTSGAWRGCPSSWANVSRLTWSSSGDRLAGIGTGGMAAMWRLDAGGGSASGGYADWRHQCILKNGTDIKFLSGSGSVIVTSGQDDHSRGVVTMWDTLAPQDVSLVTQLVFKSAVTHVALVPNNLLLLSALESGILQMHDLRMLGEGNPQVLWSLPSLHEGPLASLSMGWTPPSPCQLGGRDAIVATGGRDGDVCLVGDILEKGELLQRIPKAHWKKSSNIAGLLLHSKKSTPPGSGTRRLRPENASGVPVMDMEWTNGGLVTTGWDGIAQLYQWQPKFSRDA